MGLSLGAQPQRGCDLQPRVAASATLGTSFEIPNREAVAPVLNSSREWHNRVAVE